MSPSEPDIDIYAVDTSAPAHISDEALDAVIGKVLAADGDLGGLLQGITTAHDLTKHQAAVVIAHLLLEEEGGDQASRRAACRALLDDVWRVHPVQGVTILRRGIRTWAVPSVRVLKTTIQIGEDVRVTRIGDTGDPSLVALSAESTRA